MLFWWSNLLMHNNTMRRKGSQWLVKIPPYLPCYILLLFRPLTYFNHIIFSEYSLFTLFSNTFCFLIHCFKMHELTRTWSLKLVEILLKLHHLLFSIYGIMFNKLLAIQCCLYNTLTTFDCLNGSWQTNKHTHNPLILI